MEKLRRKNILFSTDGILGYKENIEKELKEIFNVVEYIESDLPNKNERTFLFKVLREISKKSRVIEKYYKEYVKEYSNFLLNSYKNIKFDYFFVVAGREFSKEFIQELKKRNENIKCILFLWDKFEYTTLKKSANEFDYIFSFDPDDCKKYGFIFRASFYLDKAEEKKIKYMERKYDFFYLGSLRDIKRYQFVEEIFNFSKKLGLNSFFKLYVDKKNKKYLPLNYLENLILRKKISYEENLNLIKNSRVILEIHFSKQLGLTLRSIEAIGSETKVITTNNSIKNYDFYNKENIIYIEKLKDISLIPKEFFLKEYKKLPEKIKEKYTVRGFIKDIFEKIEKKKV